MTKQLNPDAVPTMDEIIDIVDEHIEGCGLGRVDIVGVKDVNNEDDGTVVLVRHTPPDDAEGPTS